MTLLQRFVPCVKLLLSYKPDLSIKDRGDMTAAECAGELVEKKKNESQFVLVSTAQRR